MCRIKRPVPILLWVALLWPVGKDRLDKGVIEARYGFSLEQE